MHCFVDGQLHLGPLSGRLHVESLGSKLGFRAGKSRVNGREHGPWEGRSGPVSICVFPRVCMCVPE